MGVERCGKRIWKKGGGSVPSGGNPGLETEETECDKAVDTFHALRSLMSK